jgi:hypothetical protein
MDIINNHVGHKYALQHDGPAVDLCRAMHRRVRDRAWYIVPEDDPTVQYFARNFDATYEVPVYRRLRDGSGKWVEAELESACALY